MPREPERVLLRLLATRLGGSDRPVHQFGIIALKGQPNQHRRGSRQGALRHRALLTHSGDQRPIVHAPAAGAVIALPCQVEQRSDEGAVDRVTAQLRVVRHTVGYIGIVLQRGLADFAAAAHRTAQLTAAPQTVAQKIANPGCGITHCRILQHHCSL